MTNGLGLPPRLPRRIELPGGGELIVREVGDDDVDGLVEVVDPSGTSSSGDAIVSAAERALLRRRPGGPEPGDSGPSALSPGRSPRYR